ncbi:MAG: DUF1499 domain-containing protein [Pseudomonadota bacterium]
MPKTPVDSADITELATCPSSPNCVSSSSPTDDSHFIEPIQLQDDLDLAWATLLKRLDSDASFTVSESNERYIRAVATTKILRFKDDVEFLLNRDAGTIELRSASRVGYSDMGKNRARMEAIRSALIEAGVARTNE